MATVEWCGCGHDKEDHAAGHCAGEMVFDLNDGRPAITTPCACEGFKFWYADDLCPKCESPLEVVSLPYGKSWTKCSSCKWSFTA
jgi:hypothetical protein